MIFDFLLQSISLALRNRCCSCTVQYISYLLCILGPSLTLRSIVLKCSVKVEQHLITLAITWTLPIKMHLFSWWWINSKMKVGYYSVEDDAQALCEAAGPSTCLNRTTFLCFLCLQKHICWITTSGNNFTVFRILILFPHLLPSTEAKFKSILGEILFLGIH